VAWLSHVWFDLRKWNVQLDLSLGLAILFDMTDGLIKTCVV
jgi:hypothetical protein